MKNHWSRSIKARALIWLYVIMGPVWVIVTNYVYREWTHTFTLEEILFTFSRTSILYLLSGWVLYRLLRRLEATERRYENLLKLSPQPIFVHSNEKWVYANPAALRLLGAKRPGDILGHSLWDTIHAEDREHARGILNQLQRTGRPTETYVDRRLVRLDGQVVDVEFLAAPLTFDGNPAIQVLYTDVTEKKALERKLRSVLMQLESFIEHNIEAIALFDTDNNITKLNSSYEQLFGVTRESLIGQHWLDSPVIPVECLHEAQELLLSVANGETITQYRTVRQRMDGTKFPATLSVFAIKDHIGKMIGWSLTVRDISQQIKAEQRILQTEKLVAIGQLAAGVAHEIRNPLTSLLGFLRLLPSATPDKLTQYVGIMTNELERIASTVTEMVILAKPQALQTQLVSISSLLEHVYRVLEPEATMQSAELVMSKHTPNVHISGDENQLKQVLINVIRNAMDALSTPPRKVHLGAELKEEHVVIHVQDTGIGMSEEQMRHILDPFFTTKANGTGLGLHVCQQILERHHGSMRFASELGTGTTVYLTLPLPDNVLYPLESAQESAATREENNS